LNSLVTSCGRRDLADEGPDNPLTIHADAPAALHAPDLGDPLAEV